MKDDEKAAFQNKFWNWNTLIVVVILGIIVGYLSYLHYFKRMDKMDQNLIEKTMEQIDSSEIKMI